MRPRIIAHRGHKTEAPEQTLAAYSLAADLGAEMIEADIHLTRDGVAVMLHDDTLDRTTSGRGRVALRDWDEIRHLDAGSWFAHGFAAERIPRLDDLFALADERGLALCLEAKGEDHALNTAAAVRAANEIARRGRLEIDAVASFDHLALLEAADAVPGLRTAPDRLPERGPSSAAGLIAQAKAARAPIIQHHFADLDAAVVAEVQAAGIELWAWPPTTEEEVRLALATGAAGVMGDDVRTIVRLVTGAD